MKSKYINCQKYATATRETKCQWTYQITSKKTLENNNTRPCPDNCGDKQQFITNCQCGFAYNQWLLPHHTLAHDGCEIITKYE